jgi:5-formyltetrahydrofolate cyclo-ligase
MGMTAVRCSHAMDEKPALRSRLRAARARRDSAELADLGERLARCGAALAPGTDAVAAYAGVGDEPPTRPLLDLLAEDGLTVWLPVVVGRDLRWSRYAGWSALVDRHGLLEPAGEATKDELQEVDLIFAPALAVDRSGNRLGRGGGYYDRALAGVPRERIVSVVFTDEVLDALPTHPHDVRVGRALTPDGVVLLEREPDR